MTRLIVFFSRRSFFMRTRRFFAALVRGRPFIDHSFIFINVGFVQLMDRSAMSKRASRRRRESVRCPHSRRRLNHGEHGGHGVKSEKEDTSATNVSGINAFSAMVNRLFLSPLPVPPRGSICVGVRRGASKKGHERERSRRSLRNRGRFPLPAEVADSWPVTKPSSKRAS